MNKIRRYSSIGRATVSKTVGCRFDSFCLCKLAILIIILLSSTICSGQYYLDSTNAAKTIKIKFQRDSLLIVTDYQQTENDSLKSGIILRDKKLGLKDLEIAMQDTIIKRQDNQLRIFENKPIEVREIKTSFWTYAGIAVSGIATGLIIGIVVK